MRKRLFYHKRDGSSVGTAVFVAVLCGAVVAIGAGLLTHRAADTALVMATTEDCRRAFSETTCEAIITNAFALHAGSAPRYRDKAVCELDFGDGGCSPVALLNTTFFAPTVAAVVSTRDMPADARGLVPLYFEPHGKVRDVDGRRVFYRGVAVGFLSHKRFGGAGMSMLTDLSGKPLTSDAVRKLRRG